MKKLSNLLSFLACLAVAIPVKAEVMELADPNWQEVHGSYSATFDSSAFVNINIARVGETVIYDLLGVDLNYARRETNCRTGQSRNLKFGTFNSRSQVELLRNQPDPWFADSGAILEFVCRLATE